MGTSKFAKRPTNWSVDVTGQTEVRITAPQFVLGSREVSHLTSKMRAAFQSGGNEPLPEAGYQALRRVSRAIAAHHDIKKLFRSLADELRPVVNFVFLRVFLYDEVRHLMRLHVSEAPGQPAERFSEFPPEGTAVGWVYEKQEPLVIPDVEKETRFPRLHGILKEYGIRSHVTFPLTTAHGRLGTFAVGSDHPDAYSDEDCRFLALVADQIAVAIDDALHLQALERTQVELENRNQRLQLLLDVNNSIASNLNLRDLLLAISANVRRVMQADFVGVALPDPAVGGALRGYAYESPEGSGPRRDGPQFLHERPVQSLRSAREGRRCFMHHHSQDFRRVMSFVSWGCWKDARCHLRVVVGSWVRWIWAGPVPRRLPKTKLNFSPRSRTRSRSPLTMRWPTANCRPQE